MDRFCEDGETFADTCILNHDKFHKTCLNNFDSYHFEQLKKNASNECKTPDNTKKFKSRSSFSSLNFQSTCIFCDKGDGYLRIARTFDIDRRLCEGALLLSDEKLIAKLSEGDKYHAKYIMLSIIMKLSIMLIVCVIFLAN